MRLLLDLQGAQGSSRHSGLGRYSLDLARGLVRGRGGHEVLVLVNGLLRAEADAIEAEFAAEAAVHRFFPPEHCAAGSDPHHPGRLLGEAIRAQAILALQPDIIHVGSLFEGWNQPLVTTWPDGMAGPRMVATLYDLIPLTRADEYLRGAWREAGLVPWYMRHFAELRRMDGLLCISAATLQEGLGAGLPAAALREIGTGVAAHFRPARGAPAPVPGRYLLCLGLNDGRKNEARLIAAMGLLPPGLRDGLSLVVTGAASPSHLAGLAAKAGLAEGSIRHLGRVPDAMLPALYSHAALFIMPSLAEGFGLPLAEAMACGAPFAASRVPTLGAVSGRDDVLFDPLDVADMARVMERILGDDALADALRAYGPEAAAAHDWSAVATRAWAAMEGIAGPPRPAKPSLALTGPLPPIRSGIADHTAELLPELDAHYAITLVSDSRPAQGHGAGLRWLSSEGYAARPYTFDRVLHQLGNSALHHLQHETLVPLRPGVSVLHDVALPEYRQWAACEAGRPLAEALYRNHGYPALLAALGGDPVQVAASLPMSAQLLEQSLAAIVHSQVAAGMLRAAYGDAATAGVHVLPLLRRLPVLPARAAARARLGVAEEMLLVVSFGACVPKKLPLRLLEGFCAAGLGDARLVFAGPFQPGLDQVLRANARGLGLAAERLLLTGAVERAAYEDWLAAADIAVQLRGTHQGETSAAVADVLGAGLACIANASGSMAEMPDAAVLMLPENFTAEALVAALRRLAGDGARRQALGAAGRAWVASALDPARVAMLYRDIIEAAHRAPVLAVLRAAADLAPLGRAVSQELGAALAAGFPPARQGRLHVDEAAGWDVAGFAAYHDGRRPEPVRLMAQGWMESHAALATVLRLEQPAAPDGAVAFQPGDVLLTAGDHAAPPGVTIIRPESMAG